MRVLITVIPPEEARDPKDLTGLTERAYEALIDWLGDHGYEIESVVHHGRYDE